MTVVTAGTSDGGTFQALHICENQDHAFALVGEEH
jgi:hypothetical protein